MKTLCKVIYLGLGVLMVVAVTTARASALQWERTEVRLVAREGDEKVEATFPVKNTSSRVINITRIESGCGCTTAQLTDNSLRPGASGEVKVTFRLEGRVGAQNRIVTIKTDEPMEEVAQQLCLKVDIISPVVVQPRMVFWRLGEAIEAKGIEVSVTLGEEVDWAEVTCDKARFTASWETPPGVGSSRLMIKPVATTELGVTLVKLNFSVRGVKKFITIYASVR